MEKIIIIGGGGHAKVLISILKRINIYEIVGYTDINNKDKILGVRYLGNDSCLSELFRKGVKNAVLGLGHLKKNKLRKRILMEIQNLNFKFPKIISNTATINEEVEIGCGTVVMDGAIINSGTKIGKFCIINTKSSIDHDCIIGDHTHIAPGVTLSGGVNIGNNVLICAGATIIQNKIIVEGTTVGAGATVINNIDEIGVYIGVPAKRQE